MPNFRIKEFEGFYHVATQFSVGQCWHVESSETVVITEVLELHGLSCCTTLNILQHGNVFAGVGTKLEWRTRSAA